MVTIYTCMAHLQYYVAFSYHKATILYSGKHCWDKILADLAI